MTMFRTLFAGLLLIGLGGVAALHAETSETTRLNCRGPFPAVSQLTPADGGPAVLARVYCQVIRPTPFSKSPALVSPDARSIAYYEHDTILRTAELGGGDVWTDYHADLGTFARFGSEIRSVRAFAWSSRSQFLWA